MWGREAKFYSADPVLSMSILVIREDITSLARLITWKNALCCSNFIITKYKNTIINVISRIA